MQFASAFLHAFVVIESDAVDSSQGNRFLATVPVPEFDCIPGSIEHDTLSAAVSDANLETSITMFIPAGGRQYGPENVVNVAAKLVALPHQPLVVDATMHQT